MNESEPTLNEYENLWFSCQVTSDRGHPGSIISFKISNEWVSRESSEKGLPEWNHCGYSHCYQVKWVIEEIQIGKT